MKRFIIAAIATSMFSSTVFAGAEQYSSKRWLSFGSYSSIVLPYENSQDDSKFYGLVVDCSPSQGTYRIFVKDIYSKPGEMIRWETDKEMGSISNKSSMVLNFRVSMT
ncbi:hypothetical protein [Endozoicomonas sp. Mp262]|uniref:hypothetical protein n=1 Tax=Endozoicomonas sp. Mp262 TaxID=2919499 RepID=UPI0021DA2FB9